MRRSICLLILLFLGGIAYSQSYYLVKNSNSKRRIRLYPNSMYVEYEKVSDDSTVKRMVIFTGIHLDSITSTAMYGQKFHEVTRIEYKDGGKKEISSEYPSSDNGQPGMSSYDSIKISDITVIPTYGSLNRSKVSNGIFITTTVGLVGVVLVGPFVFGSSYLSVVGASFLVAIPLFVGAALLNEDFRFKSPKGKTKGLWHLEIEND